MATTLPSLAHFVILFYGLFPSHVAWEFLRLYYAFYSVTILCNYIQIGFQIGNGNQV